VLLLNNLCRAFREGGREHKVLDNVSARIEDGSAVAIIGRSGSGKSTLLNVVSGIDRADSGSVELNGREVSALAEPERTRFRRQHIGFIYQFFNLVPTLDAEENVRLVLELNGVHGAEARRRSAAVLQEVGLADRMRSAIDTFSGGEQQRVAIARALVHEPSLLLADEPTGNLDSRTGTEILGLIRDLHSRLGSTVVIVTHDMKVAESCGRTIALRDGKIVADVRREVSHSPRPEGTTPSLQLPT